jgi:hypothetical protein
VDRAKAEQKRAERERATQATQLEDLVSEAAQQRAEGADAAGNAEEIARLQEEAAELGRQARAPACS